MEKERLTNPYKWKYAIAAKYMVLRRIFGAHGSQVEKSGETIGQNLPSGRKLGTVEKWGFGFSLFLSCARIPLFDHVKARGE